MTENAPRRIAIVAGKGEMPLHVAAEATANGHEVLLFPIEGSANANFSTHPHIPLKIGQIGKFFDSMKAQDCHDMVLVGKFERPELSQVAFDWGAVKRIPDMMALLMGGDNAILERITAFFEQEGVKVHAVPDIAPGLMVQAGVLSQRKPNAQMQADAALGFEVLNTIGQFDIGQACVVHNGRVLAVEAAEGTDGMLARLQGMKAARSAVLVKAPKPKQELRNDMPVIGAHTINLAAQIGIAAIALKAGGVLLAGREETIAVADLHNMAAWGI